MKYSYTVLIKGRPDSDSDQNKEDTKIAEMQTEYLPRIGEIISLCTGVQKDKYKDYIVREVKYRYKDEKDNEIRVYVGPIDKRYL